MKSLLGAAALSLHPFHGGSALRKGLGARSQWGGRIGLEDQRASCRTAQSLSRRLCRNPAADRDCSMLRALNRFLRIILMQADKSV